MPAHLRTRLAGRGPRGTPFIPSRPYVPLAGSVFALLLLASCSGTPLRTPVVGTDPSDPRTRVPPAAYRSVTRGYSSQRPVEPRPWLEQNDHVAPAPQP